MKLLKALLFSLALLGAGAAPVVMAAESAAARSWSGSSSYRSAAPARSYRAPGRDWGARNYAPKRNWGSEGYTPRAERAPAANSAAAAAGTGNSAAVNRGGSMGSWLSYGAAGLAGYFLGSQINRGAGPAEGAAGAYGGGIGGFGSLILLLAIIGLIVFIVKRYR